MSADAVQITKQWIADLRSPGNRYQIRDSLMDRQGGFCGLGILADNSGFLPYSVGDYIDEKWINIVGLLPDEADQIIKLNDLGNKSFNEIADHIEQIILPRRIAEADQIAASQTKDLVTA